MATIRRILGKRGRTTIPYEFRQILNMRCNDVLTFAMNDDRNCVVITKEKICDDCIKSIKVPPTESLIEIVRHLGRDEQMKLATALFGMLAVPGGDANAT